MVGNLKNIFMEHDNDFWHTSKMDNFDPYNVLLAIATTIPVLLMTGFVLQGHIFGLRLLCSIPLFTHLYKSFINHLFIFLHYPI